MIFSPQQIKFEFLSYLKEFGGNPQEWRIGVAEDAPRALFSDNGVDEDADIWLWKPALSASAARIVVSYFTERHGMPTAIQARTGASHCAFMFRKRAQDARLASVT